MSQITHQFEMENGPFDSAVRAFESPEGFTIGWGKTVGNSLEGWAPGAMFFHTDGAAGDYFSINTGTKASATWTAIGESPGELDVADANSNMTGTTVEAVLDEHAKHIQSAQAFLGIPLTTFRETSNFDVGNLAGHGTILASDSAPLLDAINGATDGCQRILWASSNNDQIATQVPLPPDLDTGSDLVLHTRIVSGGTTNAVGFTVDTFYNEGDTKITDTSGTNQTATYAEVTTTIANADVPTGAQTMTIGLTPVAHTNDTMAMTAAWLEYTRKLLTS